MYVRSTLLTGKVVTVYENVISGLHLHEIYQILRFIYITTKEPQKHSLPRLEKAFSLAGYRCNLNRYNQVLQGLHKK